MSQNNDVAVIDRIFINTWEDKPSS